MSESPSFHLRPHLAGDRAEITLLAERIKENGIPPWRDLEKATVWHEDATASIFVEVEPGDTTLVAEAEAGGLLGFVTLRSNRDFQTGEEQGYVSDFAVAAQAEGRGVAQALMAAAEEWARARQFRCLALDVFAMNQRARAFYTRAGFVEQNVKMIKVLGGK